MFGVYIKDAEQEVYHCYAFEAEGSNKDVAIAFGSVQPLTLYSWHPIVHN